MSTITYDGIEYPCPSNETVLEILTRHGVPVPFSCRSGICQTCLMKAVKGHPPAEAQKGLKDTLRAQNYFMSCVCKPVEDIEVALADNEYTRHLKATVVGKKLLNQDILQLKLECNESFDYHPGQFLHLFRDDGLVRSYSIASLPQHNEPLELHIRKLAGGQMTAWLHEEVEEGDTLDIAGAVGDCFYIPGNKDGKILLIGTGSGLAPLLGIARDALDQGHKGPIQLFHGSYTREGLYLVDDLTLMSHENDNFYYTPCVDQADDSEHGFAAGRIDEVVLATLPDLKGWKVYICGHPDMVETMKKKTFLAGASLQDIYSDSFISSPNNNASDKANI